jgi:hypothetical protein
VTGKQLRSFVSVLIYECSFCSEMILNEIVHFRMKKKQEVFGRTNRML